MSVCVERENQLRQEATDVHPEAHCASESSSGAGFQCMI